MIKNRFKIPVIIITMFFAAVTGCREEAPLPIQEQEENDINSGGDMTVYTTSSLAFSMPSPNLSGDNLIRHRAGDALFGQAFVKAPASFSGGLGPLFNNNSCINCHISDGRGGPPPSGSPLETMLFRISIPGMDAHGGPNPVPGFGGQLQDKAVYGYEPEGTVNISYIDINGTYPDGTAYVLHKPVYTVTGRVPSDVLLSPRVAPGVFGSGLLEAIPEADILALADENDSNGDGISGKPNYVWNVATGQYELGRFGWKANTPTLLQQTAAAYVNDMGVTSPYFPHDNDYGYPGSDTTNDDPEITQDVLDNVVFYTQTLGVPARRNYDNPDVKLGKQLFKQVNCSSCHTPSFTTGTGKIAEVSKQKIHPYTDMLLHDMGDELADNRPDYKANGREWRTPPLWGIGLVEIVNGHSFFMHDGRARSLEEAILWHFGEGQKSREAFMKLTKAEREALIKYLKSL